MSDNNLKCVKIAHKAASEMLKHIKESIKDNPSVNIAEVFSIMATYNLANIIINMRAQHVGEIDISAHVGEIMEKAFAITEMDEYHVMEK